jgi:hypothetical protein
MNPRTLTGPPFNLLVFPHGYFPHQSTALETRTNQSRPPTNAQHEEGVLVGLARVSFLNVPERRIENTS